MDSTIGPPSKAQVTAVATAAVIIGLPALDAPTFAAPPEKAVAHHDPRTPPAIVEEETGLIIHDLYMGHSHDGAFKAAVSYYLVFENPGEWIRRGSTVTVLLGDAQVEHVQVD